MRFLRFPYVILIAGAMTCSASAALIAYDGFEGYTAGNNINGGSSGTGWSGNWATDNLTDLTVQTKSISDVNGLVVGGNQALRSQPPAGSTSIGNDIGNYMNRGFASQSGDVYLSLLIRTEGGVGSDDFYNFQVSDGATGNSSSALGVGIRNAGGNPFFARAGSSSNATTNSSTNATINTTFLLVAKFSKDGSTDYNRTDLFINPLSSVEPGTTDATATFGGTGISSLSLFSVRNFQPEQDDTVFIDEIRIGSTFEDVVPIPEPGSAIFLGVAGLFGLLYRRRKG